MNTTAVGNDETANLCFDSPNDVDGPVVVHDGPVADQDGRIAVLVDNARLHMVERSAKGCE